MPENGRLSSRGTLGHCRPRAAVIRTCGSPKAIAFSNSPPCCTVGNNGSKSLLLIMGVVIRQWAVPADLETTSLRYNT